MSNVFVFRPGAAVPKIPSFPPPPIPLNLLPPIPNVFNKWSKLMGALNSTRVAGRKVIEFDDSNERCVIPASDSPYQMKDVSWAGFGPRTGQPRTIVEISDGARFENLRMLGGQIMIINRATGESPIADFTDERFDQVHIGLRDDCGSTHVVNQGKAPLFELGSGRAVFFLQNCLFGVSAFGQASRSPLIHVETSKSRLVLNLLGQSVLGPDVVRAEGGASVLFGAVSFASQIAAEQEEAKGGVLRISPLARIQREILPVPPALGPVDVGNIALPNALIRCSGLQPAVQTLPKIVGGFKVVPSDGDVNLYSGGQELVVAEVEGGTGLGVKPSAGNKIDGRTGGVSIGPHGSRTFVSDGKSNWITVSVVDGRLQIEEPEGPQPGEVAPA
jgi:hypothetical protein